MNLKNSTNMKIQDFLLFVKNQKNLFYETAIVFITEYLAQMEYLMGDFIEKTLDEKSVNILWWIEKVIKIVISYFVKS